MNNEVHASQLSDEWLAQQGDLKVLSLDCFDTLFWRSVAEPTDVFYKLAQTSQYQRNGISVKRRVAAEAEARRIKWLNRGSYEVTLGEIYRRAAPSASDVEIQSLKDAELHAEAEVGFIFKPVWSLIQSARRRGIRVIIVSDIYMSEGELKSLLFGVMPSLAADLYAVFTSSTYGHGKTGALWKTVCASLQVQPSQLCHIGDNVRADYDVPSRFGIRAYHLIHGLEGINHVLEQREQVALQIFPEIRKTCSLPSIYHGQIASKNIVNLPERMGYITLGPIMHAFAMYLDRQRSELESSGKNVKFAFLMRDGYLPSLACEAYSGESFGANINVSRFAAYAASFRQKEDIIEMLSRMLNSENIRSMMKQLLFDSAEIDRLCEDIDRDPDPQKKFFRIVSKPEVTKLILARSAKFRSCLITHIVNRTGVKRGDTLALVDLGYTGTAQLLLAPILRDEIGVDLIGRYLICAEAPSKTGEREGLIDFRRLGSRAIAALTGQYIAAFEMMCAQAGPSTIGYTQEGDPIFANSDIKSRQNEVAQEMQKACLQFIRDMSNLEHGFHRSNSGMDEVSACAAIDIGRLLYFPSRWEIECLKEFEFDFNMGTSLKMSIVDPDAALTGMKRSGYNFMEDGLDTMRMGYPMELRYLDLALASMLFSSNVLGFNASQSSISFRRENLSVLISDGNDFSLSESSAMPTYDGFFSVHLPLSSNYNLAVLFGKDFECIQVDSIELVKSATSAHGKVMGVGEGCVLDGIEVGDFGVWKIGADGMMLIPALDPKDEFRILRVVFRPLAKRIRDARGGAESVPASEVIG